MPGKPAKIHHHGAGNAIVRSSFVLAVCLCLLSFAQPVLAAVVWSGDLDPADPTTWTSRTTAYIGKTGYGMLEITDDSDILDGRGYIGYQSVSTGMVRVDGAGSTWENSYALHIGHEGRGTLVIELGGKVSNHTGYIGHQSGSRGEVTVSVLGSRWTNNGDLYIGHEGYGMLNVLYGGAVTVEGDTRVAYYPGSSGKIHFDNGTLTTGNLFCNSDDLTGTGTINTHGLVCDVDLIFNATYGLNQILNFAGNPGQDITVNLAVDGSGVMGAGYDGAGTMSISDGRVVESTEGYIGYKSGSTGEVTVDGAGSMWANVYDLCVGDSGNGALSITNGGAVTNTHGYIGHQSGSTGVVTVDGAGSMWTKLITYIGYEGSGTLNITNGGTVDIWGSPYRLRCCSHIGCESGSTGDVMVDGAGSTWEVSWKLYVGDAGSGTLDITGGGEVNSDGGYIGCESGSTGVVVVDGAGSTWTNSGGLYVGDAGSGTLDITGGGEVSSDGGYIGCESGSTGAVMVDGAGSTWTNSGGLYIGDAGSGTLDITGGGVVTVGGETWVSRVPGSSGAIHFDNGTLTTDAFFCSSDDLTGTGTINTHGLVSDANLVFNTTYGLNQILTLVGDPGESITVNLTVDGSDAMGAGYGGVGTMSISGGIVVESTDGYIGYKSGSTGVVTVDGAGSTWTNSGGLYVGDAGSGTLDITGGGEVSSDGGYIGHESGSTGHVMVDGAGSTWTNSCDLYVGNHGSGMLDITEGGTVGNGNGYIGYRSNATGGHVTVDGAGSTWTNDGDLAVTHGTLNITDGGTVSNNDGYVSDGSLLIGEVTVDGVGSTWTNRDNLYVGHHYGSGTLNITGGGTVSCGTSYIKHESCEVTVDGAGSTWTNSDALRIKGTLNITNGGKVSNRYGYIDGDISASGVTVDGAGSTWTSSGDLYVGYYACGVLNITDGGTVSNSSGCIGDHDAYFSPDSMGEVTVDGVGSTWTNSGTLYVGKGSDGVLNITNGGAVSNSSGYIGYYHHYNNATGVVTVDGVGSTWTNRNDLCVGRQGSGTLNITNGGLVSIAGILTIDDFGDGNDFINMDTGGMLALFGDADDSLGDFLGLINGTGAIRYWDDSVSDWADITGATYGDDYTLGYMVGGCLDGYTVLSVGAPEPGVAGDANGDGMVNVDDAAVLATYWQTTSGAIWGMGDFNGDGAVNDVDATLMAANWGSVASADVPEPTTLAGLLGLCLAGLLGLARRRMPLAKR